MHPPGRIFLDSVKYGDYLHDVARAGPATRRFQLTRKQMGSTPSGELDPTLSASVSPQHMMIRRGSHGCAMARNRV